MNEVELSSARKHPGPEGTCQRIMRAARNIIREQGSRKFTIRAVARKAGVSPGLIIQYYGTRAGLIHRMFVLSNTPVREWLDENMADFATPEDLIMGLILDRLEKDMNERHLTREVMALTWTWGAEEEARHTPYLRELADIAARALEKRFYPGAREHTLTAAMVIASIYAGVLRIGAQKNWPVEKCSRLLQPAIAMTMAGLDKQVNGPPA